MSIEKALNEAKAATSERSDAFTHQLKTNLQFVDRMQKAGVVPSRQEFTIPLMERIALRS